MYVDQDLCTGCRICVDACKRGAVSVNGGVATIDEALCTSCGRCLDVCASGAIISVDSVSETTQTAPTSVPARTPQAQPLRARATPLPPAETAAAAPAAAAPAPATSAQARLETAETILAGLLSFASFIFGRRQSRLTGRSVGHAVSSASGAAGYGRSGPRQIRGGGRAPHSGEGLGRAQHSWGRRGLGSSCGQGYRCRVNKRRSV